MRFTRALLLGAGFLLGCGSSGNKALDPAAPDAPEVDDHTPPPNTVGGPVCPSCVMAGGETSDFDGGQPPCIAFIKTVVLPDTEAETAGYAVGAYRQRLERSFEAPLRWTDLTTTSALPRPTPVAGYQPETVIRGSVTTGETMRTFFDETACDSDRQCPANVTADECLPFNDVYNLVTGITLATDDGAIDTTLTGAIYLPLDELPPGSAGNGGGEAVLAFGSHVDIAEVSGTLRVEPPPGANRGSLELYLGYFGDTVRGRLEVNFTNGWRQMPGVPISPIDEQPLVAVLQADDCPFDIPPVALAEPQGVLGEQSPADALATLRALIAPTDARATWTHMGTETTIGIEIESRDYACVKRILDVDSGSYVGRGQLVRLPIRVRSSDGLLDWSAPATYVLGDAAANLPHRLAFEEQFTATSPRWHDAFADLQLATHTERVILRFESRYPVTGAETAPANDSAKAVLQVLEQSACPGNNLDCSREQAETYKAACLVAPPGAACTSFEVLGRSLSF